MSVEEPAVLRPLDLLHVLVVGDVEFVVIGGFCLAAYGYQRATKDVDVVPAPGPANLGRLYAALGDLDAVPLETEDFRPEEMPVQFDLEGLESGGNWALATNLGRLDLMQHVEGVHGFEALRRNAEPRDIPGVGRVWFAGLDDLIAMKQAAGRPQDLLDVEELAKRAG